MGVTIKNNKVTESQKGGSDPESRNSVTCDCAIVLLFGVNLLFYSCSGKRVNCPPAFFFPELDSYILYYNHSLTPCSPTNSPHSFDMQSLQLDEPFSMVSIVHKRKRERVWGCLTRRAEQQMPPRRRTKASPSRRRRLSPRAQGHHAFDDLPWLSTLESAPEHTNPWDIADLSLIPDTPSSASGPIRRRKTSLRSNPIASDHSPALLLRDTLPLPTPRSRFLPERVLFHNLMPVSFNNPL